MSRSAQQQQQQQARGRCVATSSCVCKSYAQPQLFGSACLVCGHDRMQHSNVISVASPTSLASLAVGMTPLSPQSLANSRPDISKRSITQQLQYDSGRLASTTATTSAAMVAPVQSSTGMVVSEHLAPAPRSLQQQQVDALTGTKCVNVRCDRFVPLDENGLQIPYCSAQCYHADSSVDRRPHRPAAMRTTSFDPQALSYSHQPYGATQAGSRRDSLVRRKQGDGGTTTIQVDRGDKSSPVTVVLRSSDNSKTRGTRGTRSLSYPSSNSYSHSHGQVGGFSPRTYSKVQQAELLSKAADAASMRGDVETAENLYIEAADAFDSVDPSKKDFHYQADDRQLSRTRYPEAAAVSAGWSTMQYPLVVSGLEGDSTLGRSILKTKHVPHDPLRCGAADDELLRAAQWSLEHQSTILNVFREYTEGRPEMTYDQFNNCMSFFGLRGDMVRYFRTFDRHSHGSWISSADFLLAVVAMDTNTPHSGPWKAVRAGYIFRYYCDHSAGVNILNAGGVRLLLADVDVASRAHTRQPYRMQAGDKELLSPHYKAISERQFVGLVTSGLLQATAYIFRWCLLHRLKPAALR